MKTKTYVDLELLLERIGTDKNHICTHSGLNGECGWKTFTRDSILAIPDAIITMSVPDDNENASVPESGKRN